MRRVRLKIKEVAAEKHISMRQLHLRSEIALSRMKKFYRDPYIDVKLGTLARIADVLGVSICELFEEEIEKP
jgi:DNA-binding Xre family transcriptional regulator